MELFIDDINKKFVIIDFRNRNSFNIYRFNQILHFEYDETLSVEGVHATTLVTHMAINVQLDALGSNLVLPLVIDPSRVGFHGLSPSDDLYVQQKKNANEIISAFAYMKNAVAEKEAPVNDSPPEQATPVQATSPVDVAEALRKFKQLEVDGIITAEEFEAKKKKLLGL